MLGGSYIPKEAEPAIASGNRTPSKTAKSLLPKGTATSTGDKLDFSAQRISTPRQSLSDAQSTLSAKSIEQKSPDELYAQYQSRDGAFGKGDRPQKQRVKRLIVITSSLSPRNQSAVLKEVLEIIGGPAYTKQLLRAQNGEIGKAKTQQVLDGKLVADLHLQIKDSRFSFDPEKELHKLDVSKLAREIAHEYLAQNDDTKLFENLQDALVLAHAMPENLGEPFVSCMHTKVLKWRNNCSGHDKNAGDITSKMKITPEQAKELEASLAILIRYSENHGLEHSMNSAVNSRLHAKSKTDDPVFQTILANGNSRRIRSVANKLAEM